jgi:hypothetical protein
MSWLSNLFKICICAVLITLLHQPSPVWAGCSEVCVEAATEQADITCADQFQRTSLKQFCDTAFRQLSEQLITKPKIKCKQGSLRFKSRVTNDCYISPEQVLPIARARCVGKIAFIEALEACESN